jgi:hypothetical protein
MAVIAVWAGAARADETPSQSLDEARDLFRAAKWTDAIAVLSGLLYPEPSLASPSDLAEAHLMLGVSYFETDQKQQASLQFEEALNYDGGLELTADLHSEAVVDFFRAKKREFRRKSRDDERRAARDAAIRKLVESTQQVRIEHHPYYINFVPFGAGQFQNNQPDKGRFFFITEAAFGGTSLTFLLIQIFRYGVPMRFPRDEVELAANLQRVQVGTGIAFSILYAWGVVDALRNYRPTVVTTTKIDPQHLPPELLEPEANEPESTPQSFRIEPLVGPQSVGLGVRWEF